MDLNGIFSIGFLIATLFLHGDDRWVGKAIVLKSPTVAKRVAAQNNSYHEQFRVYRVVGSKGTRLWIKSLDPQPISGKVAEVDVILYVNSIEYFTAESHFHPTPYIYTMLGITYAESGSYDKAMRWYDAAIQLDNNYASAYMCRANIHKKKKRMNDAMADYDKAIQLSPDNSLAFYNRGNARLITQEYKKAIADYDEAIKLDPTFVSALNNRGHAHAKLADYEKAIEDFSRSLELFPGYAAAHYNRGNAWYKKEEYKKALVDFHRAHELDPLNSDATLNLAWIYASCPITKYRDGKRALELTSQALDLISKPDLFSIETLAASYAQLGQFDLAIRWERRALSKANSDEERKECSRIINLYLKHLPYREE